MSDTFWHKQTTEALFPDLVWSRPENKQQAGKLLIIGGNLHGFAAPAAAYQEALQAGIGVAKVLLPDALKKTVGRILENGEYAPSTPSGSFNKQALASWLDWTVWADAVLIAGDLGRNSETAVAIEQYTTKTNKQLVITKDAVDYFYADPVKLLMRPNTTLVLSIAQLQKLAKQAKYPTPVQFSMGVAQLVEWLHEFSQTYKANLITYHNENIFVDVNGQISTSHVGDKETWRVATASHVAVWWLQNPNKSFEALTTAVHQDNS
ncbi:MAG: hypothetical protein ABIQ89_03005 [Candidatus Saccharimonadales bacterium]